MFNPAELVYCGKHQGIDVFFYKGIRIDATLTSGPDGRYVYVGLGSMGLPAGEMGGLLRWFGIDCRMNYNGHQFPDKSFYFMQKQVA